jgi:hypothetical protein
MSGKFTGILLLVLILLPTAAIAQNYTRDAGIRFDGRFSGTYRQYNLDEEAIEGILFIGRRGFTLTVLKEYFQPALGHVSENLYLQYGFGAHAGFGFFDNYNMLYRTIYLDDYRFTPLLGLDGIIGLNYRFPEFPFELCVDFKPYFEFSTIQYFNLCLNSIGVSLKYKF